MTHPGETETLGWNRGHLALGLLIMLFMALEAASVYPALPEPMASHFSGGGEPDRWSSKAGFFTIFGIALFATFVPLVGLPVLLGKTPTRYFNLPNRDYWLSPERRIESLAWLRDAVGWLLLATLALLAAVQHMVFEANLETGRLGNGFLWLMGVYGVYTIWWLVRVFRRYRRPQVSAV